jgi:flagellar basal-body rod modification protein FlgD
MMSSTIAGTATQTLTPSTTLDTSIYTPNEAARSAPKKMLGQDDFLKLLTTQMQNQDPTNPVDNTKMIADMANFSSLQAMTDLNKVVGTIAQQLKMTQAVQASMLVGRSVVDSGTTISLEDGVTPVAQMTTDKEMTDIKVQIQDAAGRTVKTFTGDKLAVGITDLGWDGKDDSGNALAAGNFKVLAYGKNSAGGSEQIGTLVAIKVSSVDVGTNGAVINLADGTSTTLDNVKQIR